MKGARGCTKKLLKLFLVLMLLASCAFAEQSERKTLEVTDYLAAQAQVDAALMAEGEAGYSFEGPLVVLNPYGNAPLSALAIFSTEESVGGTVTAKGKSAEDDITGTFPAATIHYVPIYGLYAGETTQVELSLEDGRSTMLEIETEIVETGFSQVTAETINAQAYDYSELTICVNVTGRLYAGYDSKGDLRWALTDTGANAMTLLDNGHFLVPSVEGRGAEAATGLVGMREIDPLGKVYNEYLWNGGQHHDMIELADGSLVAASGVPSFETDMDYVVKLDPETGDVTWTLDMADVTAPGASGGMEDAGFDWSHINALAYREDTDTLMISCRNQEAVIGVHMETGELAWILGDPSGWAAEYETDLLQPIGEDFGWQYGQHNLTVLSNGDLLLFDNGEFGRVKAPDADKALEDEQNYSRAVIYRIDEENKTVEQVWEYGEELGSSRYASFMSGVQLLDEASQSFLVDFGTCKNEKGFASYVEYLVEGELIWKLECNAMTYRSYRYNLYQDCVYDPSVQGNWKGNLGETVQLQGVTADVEGAQPALEGLSIQLYPYQALYISGNLPWEGEEGPETCAVVLVAQDGSQLAYDLGYTTNNGQDGLILRPQRWVSVLNLPEGTYGVYVVLNENTYDMGLDLNRE